MIGLAWSISFILWAPAILFWQYIVGERTVQPNECYIQFLSEPIITFCTAIAAFYLPVSIMAVLFWKIYQETEKRAKDVQGLKGSGSGHSPSQTSNPGNGSGRAGGVGAAASQRNSSTMLHHMSSQSCSSYDLASERSTKDNITIPGGKGRRRGCGALCLQFVSLLPCPHASRKSVNSATTRMDGTEESSCDSFNNNEVVTSWERSNSEEEADGASPSTQPTGKI